MSAVRAFALGLVAFLVLGFVAAVAIGVTAEVRGWGAFDLGLGPLSLLSFERTEGGTAFTVGSGIVAVAVAGGAGNAVAAALIGSRNDRVDSGPCSGKSSSCSSS